MRWRLSVKLALGLALGLAIVFGMVSYWGRRVYRTTLEETNTASADRMSEVIKRGTRHSMLQNDREDLYFTIRSMGAQPGIKRIRIYNQEGRISFSTDPAEVDHMVDKTAEACYGCHAQSAPLTRLARPDRRRFFNDPASGRVLALINPIENDSECSTAACHAHPVSQRVLGVLDIQISMASADAHVDDYARRELLLDLIGMAALLVLCGVLVWALVQKPVQALMEGTRRFGAGELAYRIPVSSTDEMGTLADSFNRMGTELQAAREELSTFAQKLEQRVEEKTAQVQQAMARMSEMERLVSLGKLAAAVAHEINNPLAGVLTYAKLLARHMDRAEQRRAAAADAGSVEGAAGDSGQSAEEREWLAIIESETRRCGTLVKNLLTFARQVPMQVAETDINALLERLDSSHRIAHLVHSNMSLKDMLRFIFRDYGLEAAGKSKSELLLALGDFLLRLDQKGGNAVLIIDEAQNLRAWQLEEIRLLSNIETAKRKLIQIVLVGQPELLHLINSTELRQFKQRISLHFHLKPLTQEETIAYIEHRIQMTGYPGKKLFEDGALEEIYKFSEGIPRLVNALCDRALVKACVSNQHKIDKKLIRQVI